MLEHKAVQTFIELRIIFLSLHSSTYNRSDRIKFFCVFSNPISKSNIKDSFHKILFYYNRISFCKDGKIYYIAYFVRRETDRTRSLPNLSRSLPMFPELFRICGTSQIFTYFSLITNIHQKNSNPFNQRSIRIESISCPI